VYISPNKTKLNQREIVTNVSGFYWVRLNISTLFITRVHWASRIVGLDRNKLNLSALFGQYKHTKRSVPVVYIYIYIYIYIYCNKERLVFGENDIDGFTIFSRQMNV